jgi:hypothetical protein
VSAEVGRSAVYSRYSDGPKMLPWDISAFTEKGSVCLFSMLTRKD